MIENTLGILMLIFGVAGAWDGPVDVSYMEDWIHWLVFVGMGAMGLILVIT